MISEKLLEIIRMKSSFLIPYQIHSDNPKKRITHMVNEISFAFFSLISLISWGRVEAAVKILAPTPIIVTVVI